MDFIDNKINFDYFIFSDWVQKYQSRYFTFKRIYFLI